MVKVYTLLLKGGAAEKAAALYAELPPAAKKRADEKKLAEERLRTLGCMYLWRIAAAENGLDFFSLRYCENGKPAVNGGYISFSHKGELCVCALSDSPVGTDAEKQKPEMPKAAERLNAAERAYIGDSAERFYLLWTKKEAILKLSGQGLRALGQTDAFDKKYRFTHFSQNGYIITVCSTADEIAELAGRF